VTEQYNTCDLFLQMGLKLSGISDGNHRAPFRVRGSSDAQQENEHSSYDNSGGEATVELELQLQVLFA